MNQVTCRECGIHFQSRRSDAVFCSCACRQRAHRSTSRITPSNAKNVATAAREKPIAVSEPATATPQAKAICDRQGSDKERQGWRQRMVWPDFIG